MDSTLTWLSSSRSPRNPSSSSPDACKLPARSRTKRNIVANTQSLHQCHQAQTVNDAFRSLEVLEEVVRLENDACRVQMAPEDAFALLRKVLAPHEVSTRCLSFTEFLDGIDAACWRTLASVNTSAPDRFLLAHASASPSQTPRRHCYGSNTICDIDDPPLMPPSGTASKPIKLRLSELYRGVTERIREKETACQFLTARLHQTIQHNNELPEQISNREATIRTMKETFMAGSAQSLDCELWDSQRTATSEAARDNIAASLEDKIQALRRRKDLRVWACNELRAAINESMTRASELKKAISVLVTEVKKEELAHKVKAKRLDGIIASVSESKNPSATAGTASTSYPAVKMVPEKMVAQGLEKKTRLLEAIEQRKTYLRARTEQVFDARNDVRVLEQKKADVMTEITALKHEIAHIQRSCTPRPDWGQLINAALVTTAIDRAEKKAKVKMESSRKKLLGQKGKHDESGDHEEPEEIRNKKLKHILTSNWSTVEKVNLMSAELTRIRTKYHAGDILLLEQAKLDHLQKEIDKTLQQLEAIKAKSSE